MKKKPKKVPVKNILKSLNDAEDKLHTAQGLIEDALSLIETAFLLHDKELVAGFKKKRKDDGLD